MCHAHQMSSLLMKIKLVPVGAEQASMTCAKGGKSEKIDYNEA